METNTRTTDFESNLGAFRAMRTRTRQRFHERRPQNPPEIKRRVGTWCARIEGAQKGGLVSKSCHGYLYELLKISSVARGQWSLYGDEVMAVRLNCSARTVRRHRKEAVDAGLVESVDGRERHMTCMVRPILPDGPVFVMPKMAAIPDTSGQQGRPILADNLLLTEPLHTETFPPYPPQSEQQKECGPSLVARDTSPEIPTEVGIPPDRPPTTPGKGPSNEEVGARAADIATHSEAWEATDKFGGNHAAFAAEWKRAPYEGTAKITAWIRRGGRLPTGNQYPANWLKHGLWENLGTPKAVPDQIGFRVELGALGAQLRRRIDPAQFRAWFVVGDAQLVSKTDDIVTLAVKNAFFANRIASDFAKAIAEASGVPGLKIVVREDGQ